MTKKKSDTVHPDQTEFEQQIGELTLDLQRVRADFENFRKRVEIDKQTSVAYGGEKATRSLLPVIDTIELAVNNVPAEIADNNWVKGIVSLSKQLHKTLDELGLQRIDATSGVAFDPELHQAALFDDSTDGETEVVAEELQAGYYLNGRPIRPAVVKVAKK